MRAALSHAALLLTKGGVCVTVGPTPRSKDENFGGNGCPREQPKFRYISLKVETPQISEKNSRNSGWLGLNEGGASGAGLLARVFV